MIRSYSRIEPNPPCETERLVRVRMRCQEVLNRTPELRLSVAVDESVLMRLLGDDLVMHEQIPAPHAAGRRPGGHRNATFM